MQASIINFSNYQKKFNEGVVYIGDLVEWQDYNGDLLEGRVKKIDYYDCDLRSGELVESFVLAEKKAFVVHFEGGFSVIAEVIMRKIVKKSARKIYAI